MPISDDEWDDATVRADGTANETTPVDEYDDEKDLVVAFLSENVDNAYTKREILLGVDFGNDGRPDSFEEAATELQDELTDFAGDVVATGMLVGDVDETLDELVAEGTVVEKAVRDGESTMTYYRLNTNEARE